MKMDPETFHASETEVAGKRSDAKGLAAKTAGLALRGSQFLRRQGLRTGDGVAVLSENHPFSLAVFWATQLAGLYYTPISVQFQRQEGFVIDRLSIPR